jgi:very-short-patch-repair endonuclease
MDDVPSNSDDPERRIAAIAVRQLALITRGQARLVGLTDRQIRGRVDRAVWEVVLPGVYRIAGTPATGRQGMLAATLWAGRRSALSHRAAGVLWGLDGVHAERLEVIIERPRRLEHPAVIVHRTGTLPRLDRATSDGIRVTAVARTLVDLAGVLDPEALELAVEDALRRELTSVARIRHRLEELGGRGREGCDVLRAIVAAQQPGRRVSGSAPEIRLRRLLVRAGLGSPVAQFRVHTPGFEAFVDLAYPTARLALEYDGEQWHGGRVKRQRDRVRDHRLSALGWRVMHVGSSDLRDGATDLITAIRAALDASGSLK